ncbi:hypothetical protein NI454_01005 [Brevundimonas diminuta]|uniref:hypothetical protein n=1 Tax=Brevundimonas TaxID=41275 RepID=UPI00209778A7|nr:MULTISPECIES: hypothetical protein [Brevundimonas]MCO8028522.1 hypothetical protein [Brevundimonas diminuta]
MSFLRRQKVREEPRPVDPADVQNRLDQERKKRVRGGGRQSTFLSEVAAEAAVAGPAPTLTGIGG